MLVSLCAEQVHTRLTPNVWRALLDTLATKAAYTLQAVPEHARPVPTHSATLRFASFAAKASMHQKQVPSLVYFAIRSAHFGAPKEMAPKNAGANVDITLRPGKTKPA